MGSSLKASLFKKSCGGHWPHDSQGHQRGCGQRPGRSLGRVNGVDTNAAFMGKKMDIYQNHPKNGIPKSDGAKSEKSLYFFLSNPDGPGVDEAGQRIRIGNGVSIDPLNWSWLIVFSIQPSIPPAERNFWEVDQIFKDTPIAKEWLGNVLQMDILMGQSRWPRCPKCFWGHRQLEIGLHRGWLWWRIHAHQWVKIGNARK
jgi:hypothetical protein